ncbi:hypothetical protein L209DRAFT_695023 [Thermothelomyces heterothallicus CBS 203.75]
MTAMTGSKPEQPDSPPKQLHVGAINPFALVEALLGRKLDWDKASTGDLLASILQTDYEELFDMRFRSILYAGIRLNDRGDKAEPIPAKEMHTLTERDLVTPDFSKVEKLGDLGKMGIKDLENIRVKHAIMSNGNLRLTLEPRAVGKTLRNSEMTTTLRELCTPFRIHKEAEWTPPNGTWTDLGACYSPTAAAFSNPVQGATSNSWLIAALMSVAWSDPAIIKHYAGRSASSNPASCCSRGGGGGDDEDDDGAGISSECQLSIKFHSKGGDKDAPTRTVTVNCELPTNKSSSMLMYCRSSNVNAMPVSRVHACGGDLWPALYEKAFAQWITTATTDDDDDEGMDDDHDGHGHHGHHGHHGNHGHHGHHGHHVRREEVRQQRKHQRPDLTQTAHGDPVKAMAQLTGREAQYFFTDSRTGADLLGLVRAHCVNQQAVYPAVAWTRPSHPAFRGCTLAGNVAYSVLGWAAPQERKRYIILRHPWGVTEPEGLASSYYPGVVVPGSGGGSGSGSGLGLDVRFWPPAAMLDGRGVFAVEAAAFKEYFAGMGVAK